MLAKEIKIRNLDRQRTAIKEQLSLAGNSTRGSERGDTLCIFFGDLYPENFKYFQQDEGFSIHPTKATKNIGQYSIEVPAYIFSVGSIKLSAEELKRVGIIGIDEEDEDKCIQDFFEKSGSSPASDFFKTN